ncbi:MAG: hypothetical protein VX650_02005 [Actinomycetota bacterium]|nr:hypothetical protein [Actinomycetota bacterium]
MYPTRPIGLSGITDGANASELGAYAVWSRANVGSSESNTDSLLPKVVDVPAFAGVVDNESDVSDSMLSTTVVDDRGDETSLLEQLVATTKPSTQNRLRTDRRFITDILRRFRGRSKAHTEFLSASQETKYEISDGATLRLLGP